MANLPKSADAILVKRLALTAALALLARAQSPQEAAAAAQRESVERQLQSLSIQAQRTRPSTASAALVSGAPIAKAPATPSSPLDSQRVSIQRQLASISGRQPLPPSGSAIPVAAAPDHPSPEPVGQASLGTPASRFDLQIQSASLQPRLSWPTPPAPVPLLDCAAMPAAQLAPLFHHAASAYGLDPLLLRAVARQESAFKPCAVSPAGAMGLMQLMPETASMLGIEDPFDATQSILGGARFLRLLLDRFQNDLPLALSAYNAGSATVERYGGIPPYSETQAYVSSILRMLGQPSPPSGGRPDAQPVQHPASDHPASSPNPPPPDAPPP
jgi:soluble lytic murein transglycosylase-like protein